MDEKNEKTHKKIKHIGWWYVQSAGKTADKLSDAVTSLYFPAKHHQGKVMDFIEANHGLHEGCPVAGALVTAVLFVSSCCCAQH